MVRTRTLSIIAGGIAALSIVGVAMAHPGFGLVDRVDVFARALGITSDEVEQAREDGTLRDLVGDLTLNELADAYDAELDEALEQALADGAISEEQAERVRSLLEDSSDGFAFGFGGFGHFGHGPGAFDRRALERLGDFGFSLRIDLSDIYADLLGLTEEEFDVAREDGTLRDLIADLDPVAIEAALVEARDAQIDEALAAGEITEEQAEVLRDSRFGVGFGHHGRFDGFRGGFGRFGGELEERFEFRYRGDSADDASSSESSSSGISI